jgi:hypothetical protein
MRTFRALIAACLFSVSFLAGGPVSGATAASPPPHDHRAHGHTGAEDDAEHRAQDLVGVPLREIEKTTAQNAERIERQTGLRPGRARAGARADADPGVSGRWSPVVDTTVVPVFTAVLPNGKVLIWDSVGDKPAETYPAHDFTRAMVWNPVDDTQKRVDLQGTNLFCAGFAHLPDGNILVAGGNANAQLAGTVRTYVFDWRSETWTRGRDMAGARWYPSVTEMANGEQVIIGGGPATAEVYQTNGVIRPLPNFTKYSARIYPFMISRPDTQLGLFGPTNPGYTITTTGNGAITGTAARDSINRDYGSFSTFDIGRTLVVGGGSITEDGVAKRPTRTAVILDATKGLTPAVTTTASMSAGRRQHNATVLADGSVLVTGGMSSTAVNGLVDLNAAVTTAELWNPVTGQWTVLSAADRIRQYHSTAALLPDGRVLTGGGGICAACMSAGYLEKNVEYFSPPYLFKKDGSGEPADRPVISAAPASVGIGAAFTVTSAQAASIAKVGLVGFGDVTHSVDQGQRYIPLKYTVSGTTLTVTGPPTGGVAPPGHYMLFVTDTAGVPSVARTVQVAKAPAPLMSPLKNSTGKCVDIPGSALTARTYLQTYTCNNSKAQALTRFTDNTLRVFGMCADVPSSNYVSGQRIWQYGCNGTGAQRWQFGADGTVRPVGNTGLCLAAAATTNAAQVTIVTCSGAALQKWTW